MSYECNETLSPQGDTLAIVSLQPWEQPGATTLQAERESQEPATVPVASGRAFKPHPRTMIGTENT